MRDHAESKSLLGFRLRSNSYMGFGHGQLSTRQPTSAAVSFVIFRMSSNLDINFTFPGIANSGRSSWWQ